MSRLCGGVSSADSARHQAGMSAQIGAKMEAKAYGALDSSHTSSTAKALAGSVVSQLGLCAIEFRSI